MSATKESFSLTGVVDVPIVLVQVRYKMITFPRWPVSPETMPITKRRRCALIFSHDVFYVKTRSVPHHLLVSEAIAARALPTIDDGPFLGGRRDDAHTHATCHRI